MKDYKTEAIRKEYHRQKAIKHKGKPLFDDAYLIKSLSLRYGISMEATKRILTKSKE